MGPSPKGAGKPGQFVVGPESVNQKIIENSQTVFQGSMIIVTGGMYNLLCFYGADQVGLVMDFNRKIRETKAHSVGFVGIASTERA